jgi:large conductance mechanosensitive channel
MRKLALEFKDFLLGGNLVSTAVALVMALVFTTAVKALVADILTPIVALIFGQPSFQDLSFTINSSHFLYGDFINDLVTFAVTGLAVFLFVVKPYARFAHDDTPATKACPACTLDIPLAATRCPQCTTEIVS